MKVKSTHRVDLTREMLLKILNVGAVKPGEEAAGKPAPLPADAALFAVSTTGENFRIVGENHLMVQWETEDDVPSALPALAPPPKLVGPHSGT